MAWFQFPIPGLINEAVSEANARLIASAPELLDALTKIASGEGRFSCDPLTHAANTIEDMTAIAVAAIAKATGVPVGSGGE